MLLTNFTAELLMKGLEPVSYTHLSVATVFFSRIIARNYADKLECDLDQFVIQCEVQTAVWEYKSLTIKNIYIGERK